MKSKYIREYFCSFSSKSYYFYILGVSHLNGFERHAIINNAIKIESNQLCPIVINIGPMPVQRLCEIGTLILKHTKYLIEYAHGFRALFRFGYVIVLQSCDNFSTCKVNLKDIGSKPQHNTNHSGVRRGLLRLKSQVILLFVQQQLIQDESKLNESTRDTEIFGYISPVMTVW